jgi:8-oxo-dGTP pyrophosphatase MutT (NUDIX family)
MRKCIVRLLNAIGIDVRPYRVSVRAVIMRDCQEVLLALRKDADGNLVNYQLPGGGVEAGESHQAALEKECLEEVGVRIGPADYLGVRATCLHKLKGNRHLYFKGSDSLYFVAEYLGEDRSIFDAGGDGMEFVWVPLSVARRMIASGPLNDFNSHRILALERTEYLIAQERWPEQKHWLS